jgi:hypothetical protein
MGTFELIATIAGAVMGSQVLTTFVQSWFDKKRVAADINATTTTAAMLLIEALNRRVDKLEAELQQCQEKHMESTSKIADLEAKLEIQMSGKVDK